jgi:SNF2 family DNA or RNA helicase
MPIVNRCVTCNKIAEIASVSHFANGSSITKLKCGHLISASALSHTLPTFISKAYDGSMELYKYQAEDITNIEKASCRSLLTYECGLGKTITSAFTLANHPELYPTLIIATSAVLVQWYRELMRILGPARFPIFLANGKACPIKGMSIHLISFDLVRKHKDKLIEFGFKSLIIDECQHIKSLNTARTKAVQEVAKSIPHILALSATPIKNHAAEYFPVLNILQPEMFPFYDTFVRRECCSIKTQFGYKVGGLLYPDRFKEKTKDFIFYRKRDEVLPDLPKKRRDFEHLNIEDESLQSSYNDVIEEFTDFINQADRTGDKKDMKYFSNILEFLSKMRHITGLAKVEYTVEKAIEFLDSTDRKLVIYVHHRDVGDLILEKLTDYCKENEYAAPVRLEGGMGAEKFDSVKTIFLTTDCRILIASTLAAGEGLNLQPCSDAIFVERQWNSVNEEQAEDRFSRPGATADFVNINYLVAISTVDDYLTEIIERKRKIVKETVTGERDETGYSQAVISELVEALVKHGKVKWSLN